MSMEMAAGIDAGVAPATSRAASLPRRSFGGLVSISIFWFALNFHWAAVPIFLVPPQVVALLFRLAPAGSLAARSAWVDSHKALVLAVVVAPGMIVALLSNPFFGLLSDRTPGRFGRRRPYVLGGSLVNVVGLAIMALAPAALLSDGSGNVFAPSILVLIGGLVLVQLSNNAAAAPFHALLPDLVPEEQRGLSSGIMGVAYWLGTICGSLLPFIFGLNFDNLLNGTQSFDSLQHEIALGYGVVAGVMLLMALLTVIFVKETPWHRGPKPVATPDGDVHTVRDLLLTIAGVVAVLAVVGGLTRLPIGFSVDGSSVLVIEAVAGIVAGVGGARAFGFSPRRNSDFSWVVITRMLVMMGVYIVQNFLQLYMRDVAHAPSPALAASEFLIVLTVTATLSTCVAGWLSDRVGRKRMVYLAGTFMAIVGAAFVLAPYLLPGHILTLALVAAAVFGLGYGAYVSVDWALVADVLPSEATFARDMGVWNIGLTLSSVLAVILGGWLITLGANAGNTEFGYTLLFVAFVIFCVAGTVTIRYVRSVK